MKPAWTIVLAMALAACGQPHARLANQHATNDAPPAQSESAAPASSSAPDAQDAALAQSLANVKLDTTTADSGDTDLGTDPGGDYLGQPIAERKAQQSLPQSKDNLWKTLSTTKIAEDDARGLFTAKHPPQVRALVGQTLTLSGFIMPLETTAQFRHFLLTRYTPVCDFCPPGAPNEVVEVWSNKPIAQTLDMMRATGRFALTDNGEKGLFFQLTGADVVKAS